MAQQVGSDGLHIIRHHIIAAGNRRHCGGCARQQSRSTRAGPARQIRRFARCPHQIDDIVDNFRCHPHAGDRRHRFTQHRGISNLCHPHPLSIDPFEQAAMPGNDPPFFIPIGIGNGEFEQKTVKLGLWQWIDALAFNRILCRNHREALAERMGFPVQRDAPFLHSLQQRCLGFWRGAVDFIRQQQFGKNRPACQGETRRLKVEQVRAQYIARHQIRRELDSAKIQPDGARETLCEQCFSGARRPFE